MLNIGKLAAGGEDYYMRSVADGMEEYYTGRGEAPGTWTGASADSLQLAGHVSSEALRTVLGGVDPRTGRRLGSGRGGRCVPGFDLAFRAPKSVSLLWGLGDADTARQVREAHDVAVATALSYMEDNAAWSRRGAGGRHQIPGRGFVAAAFRHRTSRAGDPLLHTHVLVANAVQAIDDGKWRTLDAKRLYMHALTGGYLYQAQLRSELTSSLGVAWQPVVNGVADLDGVPRTVIEAFSQRRTEIQARMDERGETSAAAAQVATLATRSPKDRQVDGNALEAEWLARAASLDFTDSHVRRLTGHLAPRPVTMDEVTQVTRRLLGPTGLTAHSPTFTSRDVVQQVAQHLGGRLDAAGVIAVAETICDPHVGAIIPLKARSTFAARVHERLSIRRRDGKLVVADPTEQRYSTADMIASERKLLSLPDRRQAAACTVDPGIVHRIIGERALTGEQKHMVRELTTGDAAVAVVVGRAGAGKTYALSAARAAWQANGCHVLGCALAARAAQELEDGAGIPSYTISALLAWMDTKDPRAELGDRSVVVLDEAGMVGTRDLTRLAVHVTRANAKLVLVGDHRQLPEIDAGGAFRELASRPQALMLTSNRRQRAKWERRALTELAEGSVAKAIGAYDRHGRVITADTADEVRDHLIADWWAAYKHEGPGCGIMVAARNSDVDDLNARARIRLNAAGYLGTNIDVTIQRSRRAQPQTLSLAIGDRVMILKNQRLTAGDSGRSMSVTNGSRGTITAIESRRGDVCVALDNDATVTVPNSCLTRGHLTHAYAVTGHKAQGATTQRSWLLGSDALYREWGYVAMSRGREDNRFYVVARETFDEDRDGIERDGWQTDMRAQPERLAAWLQRRKGQRLACPDMPDQIPEKNQPMRDRLAAALTREQSGLVAHGRNLAEQRMERSFSAASGTAGSRSVTFRDGR